MKTRFAVVFCCIGVHLRSSAAAKRFLRGLLASRGCTAGSARLRCIFAANRKRRTARASVRDAAAGNVVCGAMRRRAKRERESTHHRDAAVEPHQLHRDLPLVMEHREHCIKHAIACAHEDRVRRIGPDTLIPCFAPSFTAGAMTSDFFRAALAPSPPWDSSPPPRFADWQSRHRAGSDQSV